MTSPFEWDDESVDTQCDSTIEGPIRPADPIGYLYMDSLVVEACVLCRRAQHDGHEHDACWGDPLVGGASGNGRHVCLCARDFHSERPAAKLVTDGDGGVRAVVRTHASGGSDKAGTPLTPRPALVGS